MLKLQQQQRQLAELQEEGVEAVLKPKAKQTKKSLFTEEMMFGEKGLRNLYKTMAVGKKDVTGKKGNELKEVQRVLWRYRNWCHELAPNKSSNQLIHENRSLLAAGRLMTAVDHLKELHAQEGAQPQDQTLPVTHELQQQQQQQHQQSSFEDVYMEINQPVDHIVDDDDDFAMAGFGDDF